MSHCINLFWASSQWPGSVLIPSLRTTVVVEIDATLTIETAKENINVKYTYARAAVITSLFCVLDSEWDFYY